MPEPQNQPIDQVSNPKPRKKKSTQVSTTGQMKGDGKGQETLHHQSLKTQKGSKRSLKNDISPSSEQTDRSTPDSLPDSTRSTGEYRALRRKYLLLEEESFLVGKELGEVESEVKTLEDEKLALLDQLVILEGLINPSDLQSLREQ